MVDDGTPKKPATKPGAMLDRTVPMPVPRGATVSDTSEADPRSFIGENFAPTVSSRDPEEADDEPPEETHALPPRDAGNSHAPRAVSFDEEIAKKAAPPPRSARPATGIMRSPLASQASEVPDARARDAQPVPDGLDVFASIPTGEIVRARGEQDDASPATDMFALLGGVDPSRSAERPTDPVRLPLATGAAEDGATVVPGRGASSLDASRERHAAVFDSGSPKGAPPSALAAATMPAPGSGSAPVARSADADDSPTVPLTPSAGALLQTREAPVDVTPVVPQAAREALRRVSEASVEEERERFANEDTRIRSVSGSVERPRPGSKTTKALVVLFLVGVAGLAAFAVAHFLASSSPAVASLRAPTAPSAPSAPSAPTLPTLPTTPTTPTAPTAPTAPTTPTAPTAPTAPSAPSAPGVDDDTTTTSTTLALDEVAGGAQDMPAGAVIRYRPLPGYFDKSGSGALGLAPALASALAPAVDGARKANPRLAVRGEIRRAVVKDGEGTVECSLALLHDGVRRATLQTTARARTQGAARDRLLRIAAEECGRSLAPDVTVAVGHLQPE